MDKGNNKLIGVCLAKLTGQVQVESIMHITEKAKQEGYKVLVFSTFTDLYYRNKADAGESMVYELIDYDMFDGIILLAETIKDDLAVEKIVQNCKEHHVPLVAIDKEIEDAYSILYEYSDAFEEIVRHVVEIHGCRKVNLISGIQGNAFSEERVEVFKRVLEENNIPFEPERMGYGDFWDMPTEEVMKKFLNSDLEFPEAIICCNDTMAMTACRVLEEHGYNIPNDIIITGFDGCEEEKYHAPRLTTACMNVQKACSKAVDTIIRVSEGTRVRKVQKIPFDVVASQSCGCVSLHAKGKVKRVKDIYNMMNNRNDFDEFVGKMVVGITNSESLAAAKPIINKYGFTSATLCIRDDFMEVSAEEKENENQFTEKMQVFVRKYEEDERVFENFPTKQILPDLWEVLEKEDMLVVTVLHFLDKIIGYYAAPIKGEQLHFANLQRFVNQLGQSLYILRNMQRMNFLLTKDPMTEIYNRRGFYQRIKKVLKEDSQKGEEYRIIIHSVDLDGLKYINDTFGHKDGDNAITVAAHKLVEASKHSEICARFGGDEYVVFGIAAKEDAENIANEFVASFKKLLEEYNGQSGLPYQVKASCGSSTVPITPDLKLDQIISMADQLMYDEKAKHKRGQIR